MCYFKYRKLMKCRGAADSAVQRGQPPGRSGGAVAICSPMVPKKAVEKARVAVENFGTRRILVGK